MSRNASTDELYFVTLTVVDWIDVFTRRQYSDFIIENLAWCQQKYTDGTSKWIKTESPASNKPKDDGN